MSIKVAVVGAGSLGFTRMLTHDILTVEAEGSKAKAQAMLDKYAVLRPELRRALEALGTVPVDIEPLYTQAR